MSKKLLMLQGSLLKEFHLQESKALLSTVPHSERGAIYTKTQVVDFMIDLALGDSDLASSKFLEPSFGTGNFIVPLAHRLISGKPRPQVEEVQDALRGYELSIEDYGATKERLGTILRMAGYTTAEEEHILNKWLVNADFLLSDLDTDFSHAIGNPPYLRIERIPPSLLSIYRQSFSTLHDRADLYVAFFEHCLNHLKTEGILTFICTDRWMKARYGTKLRELVTSKFSLAYYLDLCGTNPFETDVTTYPAIVSIANTQKEVTLFASEPIQDVSDLSDYLPTAEKPKLIETRLKRSSSPIVLSTNPTLSLLRKIEDQHPRIEDIGCKVSIGIATGADKVFIRKINDLNIEEDVLIPLIVAKDINSGSPLWSGNYLINPYEKDGSLRDLSKYPLLNQYFSTHKAALSKRHCVQRDPSKWYRTIDKVHHDLPQQPKLLVPDIRSSPRVTYEAGEFYPHHNLYYITSKTVILETLKEVLNGGIMKLFVVHYSTPMQGGCYRFQAQHLRKICIPMSILEYHQSIDAKEIFEVIASLYGLNYAEIDLLRSI